MAPYGNDYSLYGYSDSVNITGLSELQTMLSAFGEKVLNETTQLGLDDGAKIFQAEAIQNAKNIGNDKDHNLKVGGVYIRLKAGNLSRNIKRRRIKVDDSTKGAQVYVYGKLGWYAKFVEGQENGNSRQAPKPFMRPAFETKQDEAVQAFEERITEALKDGGLI